MNTIWKFPLPIQDHFNIKMPRGAGILDVQVQNGEPCLWAIVDPEAPVEDVTFVIRGTGHLLYLDGNQTTYVGTFQMEGGALVFHLFVFNRPVSPLPPHADARDGVGEGSE